MTRQGGREREKEFTECTCTPRERMCIGLCPKSTISRGLLAGGRFKDSLKSVPGQLDDSVDVLGETKAPFNQGPNEHRAISGFRSACGGTVVRWSVV